MRIRPKLRRTQSTGLPTEAVTVLNGSGVFFEGLSAECEVLPIKPPVFPAADDDVSPPPDTNPGGRLDRLAKQLRKRGGLLVSLALHFLFGLTLTVVAVEHFPRRLGTDFTITPGDGDGVGQTGVFGLAAGGYLDGDDLPLAQASTESETAGSPSATSAELEQALAGLNLTRKFDGTSLPAGGSWGSFLGGKGSKGAGGGNGGGLSGGNGTGVGFFGASTQAASCVYVVDMSGSMHGRRFRRAISELNRSISLLGSKQRFFVIMFSDDALPLFGNEHGSDLLEPRKLELLTATSANKEKAKLWLHHLHAGGHTHPTSALKMALDLHPDVVFFLTDGEIPEEVPSEVSGYNAKHTPVHAIEFEQREGEQRLRRLSSQNFGTYRYVR